jgi:hypothetical protein
VITCTESEQYAYLLEIVSILTTTKDTDAIFHAYLNTAMPVRLPQHRIVNFSG